MSEDNDQALPRLSMSDSSSEEPTLRYSSSRDQAISRNSITPISAIGTLWKAALVGKFDVEGTEQYIIEVSRDGHRWLIRRNFKEFSAFDKELYKKNLLPAGEKNLPKLPPKSYNFLFGPSEKFLSERRLMLQVYLNTVATNPAINGSELVLTFLQPERHQMGDDTGEDLSTYYPEMGDDVRKSLVAYNDVIKDISYGKKSLTYFLTYGPKAIKDVFIFERSLNISDKPLTQSIIFDRQRLKVKNAFRFFKISLVVFGRAIEALEATAFVAEEDKAKSKDDPKNGKKKLVDFIEKCLAISKSAYNWISFFHKEETDVIRGAIKDSSADIHMIEWYDKQVALEISNYYSSEIGVCSSSGKKGDVSKSENSESAAAPTLEKKSFLLKKDAEPLRRLYDMIEQEIMYRSMADQVIAVRHLKKLSSKIFSIIHLPTTDSVTSTELQPQVIIPAFQKRYKELELTVERMERLHGINVDDDDKEGDNDGNGKEDDGLESIIISDDDDSFLTDAEKEGSSFVMRSEVYGRISQLVSDLTAFKNELDGLVELGKLGADDAAGMRSTADDLMRKVQMLKETLISIPTDDDEYSDEDSLIRLDKIKKIFN